MVHERLASSYSWLHSVVMACLTNTEVATTFVALERIKGDRVIAIVARTQVATSGLAFSEIALFPFFVLTLDAVYLLVLKLLADGGTLSLHESSAEVFLGDVFSPEVFVDDVRFVPDGHSQFFFGFGWLAILKAGV